MTTIRILGGCIGLLVGVLTIHVASAQEDPCERPTRTHKLKINANVSDKRISDIVEDKPNGRNADELHVCRGDIVEWRLQGGLEFTLLVDDQDPLLAEQSVSHSGKITTRVREDAPRGERFAYHLRLLDGDPVQPTIVVD